MSTTARLAGFGVALLAVLGIGAGVGATIGPDAAPKPELEAPAPTGGGVVAAAEGYRLVAESSTLAGAGGPFRFTITDAGGDPTTRFAEVHDRPLHLIIVNRELTSFDHVHPSLDADGTWAVDLPALPPGSYRAVADFMIDGGPRLALGTDLSVAGAYEPRPRPEPASTVSVDGYEVRLESDRDDAGEVIATLVVTKGGEPVELEPYLGAFGHLVALRAGDLAYAHVHPADGHDEDPAPGTVVFDATLDAEGRYGLFLDFKHDGTVHTASFTFDQGPVTGASEMEH